MKRQVWTGQRMNNVLDVISVMVVVVVVAGVKMLSSPLIISKLK